MQDLTLDTYQVRAHSTCTDTCNNIDYPTYEILEEAGEFEEKFFGALTEEQQQDVQIRAIHTSSHHNMTIAKARAKSVRRGEVPNVICCQFTDVQRREMAYELGDILWGVSESARQLGYTLSQIAELNLEKLGIRFSENKIVGDGDHR